MCVNVVTLILQVLLQVTHLAGANPGVFGKEDIRNIRFCSKKMVRKVLDMVVLQIKVLQVAGGDVLQQVCGQEM